MSTFDRGRTWDQNQIMIMISSILILIMNFVVTFDNAIMGCNQIQPCQPSPSFQDIDLTLSLSRGMNIAIIKAQARNISMLEAQHGDNPIHETVLD